MSFWKNVKLFPWGGEQSTVGVLFRNPERGVEQKIKREIARDTIQHVFLHLLQKNIAYLLIQQ
jgi:hypothetical protein